MALSWSLFGLLAVMCGGLLASLHALVGRMDALTADVRLYHADIDRRLSDGGL